MTLKKIKKLINIRIYSWFQFCKQSYYFMFKTYSKFCACILFCIFNLFVVSASAIDLDEATRTVTADSSGKTVVLTPEQVKRGKRLFNATCGACHTGGITKTNPNVGLDPEALSLATPRRDNINSLVDFLKNPTTYDGLESIAEIHPSIKSCLLYTSPSPRDAHESRMPSSA